MSKRVIKLTREQVALHKVVSDFDKLAGENYLRLTAIKGNTMSVIARTINAAFVFAGTSEGDTYWREIDNQLLHGNSGRYKNG